MLLLPGMGGLDVEDGGDGDTDTTVYVYMPTGTARLLEAV